MPKCTLYLSDDDNVVYQDLKKRGENPSAIFSKAINARLYELESKSADMKPIAIYRGVEYNQDQDSAPLEIVKFMGKELAKGVIGYDPQFDRGMISISQTLYVTQKGNYLLYEVTSHIDYYDYDFHKIEKNKPIPSIVMAPEILNALGIQDDVGTFLDF